MCVSFPCATCIRGHLDPNMEFMDFPLSFVCCFLLFKLLTGDNDARLATIGGGGLLLDERIFFFWICL
jgi:hypothetical protein